VGAAALVNACPDAFRRPSGLDLSAAANDYSDKSCLQGTDATTPILCRFGRTTSPTRTIVLVGNSHAWRLLPALDRYGRQHGWEVLLAAKIDCMGAATTAVGTLGSGDACVRWSAALQQQLLGMKHLDAVVFASHVGAGVYLAGRGASDGGLHDAQQAVLATWTRLVRRGAAVVVTEDVPGMRPNADPECLAMSHAAEDPCAVSRASVVRSNFLGDLAQRNPTLAHYVPLARYFCDATTCHALVGGTVVYFDSHHLTTAYSRSLAPFLGAAVAAALPTGPR
jgi:hypothetical protein